MGKSKGAPFLLVCLFYFTFQIVLINSIGVDICEHYFRKKAVTTIRRMIAEKRRNYARTRSFLWIWTLYFLAGGKSSP